MCIRDRRYTLPELLDNSQQLIHEARKLTPPQISTLMRISDKLAGINAARFHDWQPDFTPENARQAILAFKGDVYTLSLIHILGCAVTRQ